MEENIHGHEVMKMMLEEEQSFTEETLHRAIIQRYGERARFCTCSAENMSAAELIAFLKERGKFIPNGEGFQTAPEKICNH